MSSSPLAARTGKVIYEFDAFRVDPIRRRLLRAGEQVPLTPKAFSILMVLLENRGEVVEKDALIRRVWPDAYVTEANLTQNISALRKALGERANDHRYVVTVPGIGYSFVAEVMEVPRESSGEFPVPAVIPDLVAAPVSAFPPEPPAEMPSPPPAERGATAPAPPATAPHQGRRRPLLAGVALGFLLAVIGFGLYVLYGRRPSADVPVGGERGAGRPSGIRPAVAVVSLRNLSGDQRSNWLSVALAEMLITELSAGSRVRMISGEEIARVNPSPPGEPWVEPNPRQIHQVLGADLIVVGSYFSLRDEASSRLRIDLRVQNAPEGDTIASLAEVGTEEDLFDLVSTVGRRLRRTLGWADPSPEEARATQALLPANPEAARLYVEGLTRLRAFDSKGARDSLERAAHADPRSPVIHSALSLAAIGLGFDEQARTEAEKAVRLAASLPKAERLAIEARHQEARNDWSKASEIYRSLWMFYPDDVEYGLRLANSLSIAGRNAEARATVESLRRLPLPLREDPRVDLVAAQIARRLGDAAAELRASASAAEKGSRLGQNQVLGEALLLEGDALYVMGRTEESLGRLRRAQHLFGRAGNKAAQARALNRIGAVLLDTGDYLGAETHYQEALATARELDSRELVAAQTLALSFAAGYQGNLRRSQLLAEQAHAAFSELGEHLYETRSLFKIAENLWQMGDTLAAHSRFQEVLSLARKSGNRVEEGRALDGIARALVSAGSLPEARRRQEQALQIARASGDPLLAASYQAAVATTMSLQGDLPGARSLLESALETKRRVDDRLGISQVLGMLSRLAYAQGDLARARRFASEQRELAEQIQAASAVAVALQRGAWLEAAKGDLGSARSLLAEASRLTSSRGAMLLATELDLDLARLALLDGQSGEAASLAAGAADWYGERGMHVYQARALAVVTRALMAQGQPDKAQATAAHAQSLADGSDDQELQIEVATAVASAASGRNGASLEALRRAIAEAERRGYLTDGLQARIVLGTLQLQAGDPIGGRTALEDARRRAEARGFKGLARRAAVLQTGQPVVSG
jgi:DNA-binding winged helix-turn-helix (wHTH) protein/tetratricopeptide (TPR) repeat protein